MDTLDSMPLAVMTNARNFPIKLLLLIPHLGGGGAERVTSMLALHLNPKQFEIHVGLITDDAPGSEQLPPWVHVHRLGSIRVRKAAVKIWTLIWRERPSLVLSSMSHLNFLLLLLRPFFPSKTRLLVRQNTTASSTSDWRTSFLYRWLYPRATAIICQSEAMAADMSKKFAIPEKKLVALLNPVQYSRVAIQQSETLDSSAPFLLCVARLSHEKGVDLLLRALVIVKREFADVQLNVLGVGPEEIELRRLADALDLHSHVTFKGFADPAPSYARSTLFVCPSRYEGMPNALLEAGLAGLPIVATPSCEGVSQLLRGASGAWVAAAISAEEIAVTLLQALTYLSKRPLKERRFHHAFLTPFEISRAIPAYESVLLRLEATGRL